MGCQGGNAPGRQSTPQEAALGFKEAAAALDWERALGYLTQRSKAGMVGGAFMAAAYGAQADPALARSFARLAERHGLDEEDADLSEADNLAEIFVELVAWIEDNLPADQGGRAFKDAGADLAASEFSDFEVDGDRAYARRTGPTTTKRVRFTRIDGRWYLDS
jgi:hypothetical protein